MIKWNGIKFVEEYIIWYHPKKNILILYWLDRYTGYLSQKENGTVSLRKLMKHGPKRLGYEYIGEL